jgi:hypothetical protein
MIKIKSQLSRKDKEELGILINELSDNYREFYITKDRVRLFIKDNLDLFFSYLKKGDKIIFNDEGIVFITGWSDKAKRKYVRVLTNSLETADKLLKITHWNIHTDLYCKVGKTNPLIQVLEKNKFKFKGDRGSEILLYRKYRGAKNVTNYYKDED